MTKKVKMLTSVVSERTCLNEGQEYELEDKRADHFLAHNQAELVDAPDEDRPRGKKS